MSWFTNKDYYDRSIIEYVWLDNLNEFRSKVKVTNLKINCLNDIPEWNYDGSSTAQAEGDDSEIILKPVYYTENPFFENSNSYIVLCDIYKNNLPHNNNTRYLANKIFNENLSLAPVFGLEQEFFLIDKNTNRPLGFPEQGEPEKQGKYYCSVGVNKCFKRQFLDEALEILVSMKIGVTGYNIEVCPGQMELQICNEGIKACDELLLTRYVLIRLAEKYDVIVDFGAKPESGDWNGSGCHVNFSTNKTREENGYEIIKEYIKKLESKHKEHINIYGKDNFIKD